MAETHLTLVDQLAAWEDALNAIGPLNIPALRAHLDKAPVRDAPAVARLDGYLAGCDIWAPHDVLSL